MSALRAERELAEEPRPARTSGPARTSPAPSDLAWRVSEIAIPLLHEPATWTLLNELCRQPHRVSPAFACAVDTLWNQDPTGMPLSAAAIASLWLRSPRALWAQVVPTPSLQRAYTVVTSYSHRSHIVLLCGYRSSGARSFGEFFPFIRRILPIHSANSSYWLQVERCVLQVQRRPWLLTRPLCGSAAALHSPAGMKEIKTILPQLRPIAEVRYGCPDEIARDRARSEITRLPRGSAELTDPRALPRLPHTCRHVLTMAGMCNASRDPRAARENNVAPCR